MQKSVIKNKNIHHIALIVSCEEAVSFYEKFGFEKINTIDRGTDKVVLLSDGDICLEFFVDGTHPKNSTGQELLGLRHLAFTVGNVEAFLKENGFSDVEICRDWCDRNIAFIKDIDGNTLEIRE